MRHHINNHPNVLHSFKIKQVFGQLKSKQIEIYAQLILSVRHESTLWCIAHIDQTDKIQQRIFSYSWDLVLIYCSYISLISLCLYRMMNLWMLVKKQAVKPALLRWHQLPLPPPPTPLKPLQRWMITLLSSTRENCIPAGF